MIVRHTNEGYYDKDPEGDSFVLSVDLALF